MKRLPWLVAGMVVGFVAAVWSLASIRRTRGRLRVSSAAAEVGDRAAGARSRFGEAVAEGRRAMREYESDARAEAPVG